jgi:hypothetical protein
MKPELSDQLTARARLLTDPPLWCWEVVDRRTGEVLDTSWDREWVAYPSPEEALRRALPRLSRDAVRR